MPEQTATTATTDTTATTQTTTQTDTSQTDTTAGQFKITDVFNENGTLKDGWKDKGVSEELRGNKVYDIFSDFQGLTKCLGNQAVTLGKYGTTKGVLPINEKSSQTEIDAYRIAIGVPKDATGYKFTPPEDITIIDWNSPEIKGFFEDANKSNYTQSQIDTAMKCYSNAMRNAEKKYNTELAQKVSDASNRFEAEYGDKVDSRRKLASAFISKMTTNWDAGKYEELFGKEVTVPKPDGTQEKTREGGINAPEYSPIRVLLLDMFATIEEKYGVEDTALDKESGGGGVKTVKDKIDDIESAPGFMDGKLKQSLNPRDREKHEELVKLREKYIAQLS
jgi:hypothetical protein